MRAGITSHVSVIGAQHQEGRRAGVRVARGSGAFHSTRAARPDAPKTGRARTGGSFLLGDMFRFADSLALAVAGALSAALASGQPAQHAQPGGARG